MLHLPFLSMACSSRWAGFRSKQNCSIGFQHAGYGKNSAAFQVRTDKKGLKERPNDAKIV